jgi:hypothetical protein
VKIDFKPIPASIMEILQFGFVGYIITEYTHRLGTGSLRRRNRLSGLGSGSSGDSEYIMDSEMLEKQEASTT